MANATPPNNERKRVKVYELKDNDWFDRGTGYCAGQYLNDEAQIHVESEDEPVRTLLQTKVKRDDTYQKQQDTLIVWTEPPTGPGLNGIEMALSFEAPEGCSAIWSFVSENSRVLSSSTLPDGGLSESELDPFIPVRLPSPTLGNLDDVDNIIRGATQSQHGRDSLPKFIISEEYIAKLNPLVEAAEDLEDLGSLHRLCNIMKTLVLLNDTTIIEYVVRDEVILGVVGALEYDPDFPTHKANHRQYLADSSKFKEIVRIQDPEIRKKIHMTYRLQYLKDVVLARILDDPTFSVLNSLIFFNHVDIVNYFQSNPDFLTDLFAILNSPDSSPAQQKDAVLFIQQCCAIAKNVQAPSRSQLYHQLVNGGLFNIITSALQHPEALVRVAANDILVAVIDHDAIMVRNYIHKAMEEHSKPLTDTLIELLLVESDLGIKAQIADAIKVLLDPTANGIPQDPTSRGGNDYMAKMRNAAGGAAQLDGFLDRFYQQSAQKLFQPLKDLEDRSKKDPSSLSNLSLHEIGLYTHLIEILCFFVRLHSFRSKQYLLSDVIASRVAILMKCPEKHVKLAALKYFRNCLQLQDDFHTRHIIQHHLFEPILNIILETMPRDNLLNSAALELFEFVFRENMRPIIFHLVENYRERFQNITYVPTFQNILLRYDQLQSGQYDLNESSFMTSDTETPNRSIVNGGRWQGLRDHDAEEEAYFFGSVDAGSDEEDGDDIGSTKATAKPMINGASVPSKPLVDYPDDEDDGSNLREPIANLSSSPENEDELIPDAGSDTHAESAPAPPERVSEKRRREEDEDDELGKLSSGTKRRNSSSANAVAGITLKSAAGEESVDIELPDKTVPEAAAKESPPHMLRRKKNFSNIKESSMGGATTNSKKIAISLGGTGKKND